MKNLRIVSVLFLASVVVGGACGRGGKRPEDVGVPVDSNGQSPQPEAEDAGAEPVDPVDAGPEPAEPGKGALKLMGVADEDSFALAWTVEQAGDVATWEIYSRNAADLGLPVQTVTSPSQLSFVDRAGAGVKKTLFAMGRNAAGEVVSGKALDGADAGSQPFESKPFLSEGVTLSTQTPVFGDDRAASPLAAARPAVVAFDTARQFLAVDQGGQIFGYFTENRGQTFEQVRVDSVGSKVRLAFEPLSRALFACYNVGSGRVRVRVSKDLGRTWNALSADLPVPDAVTGEVKGQSADCAIAPWREGQAMMVTSDDQAKIHVRMVSEDLNLSEPELAFEQTSALMLPARPAIATIPERFVVHVGFTVTRSGLNDRDVYAVYRDPQTTAFTPPMLLSGGVSRPQDAVTLLADPDTQRAVAAFVSEEPQAIVYVSVFQRDDTVSPAKLSWYSGSHLSVFVKDSVSGESLLFKDKPFNTDWSSYSPAFARSPSGKVFLALSAGTLEYAGGAMLPVNHQVYVLPFDLKKPAPRVSSLGWFAGDAVKVGSARVTRGTVDDNHPVAFAADAQLSFYVGFIEGVGARAELPNRPVFLSRP